MKKTLLKVTIGIVLALMTGYNMYNVQKEKENLSELTLANIEALANGESGKRHTLDCGKSGLKACSATCNKCQVTLTAYGNGKTATFTCYQ